MGRVRGGAVVCSRSDPLVLDSEMVPTPLPAERGAGSVPRYAGRDSAEERVLRADLRPLSCGAGGAIWRAAVDASTRCCRVTAAQAFPWRLPPFLRAVAIA
jgi:hypothetical protein